VNALFYIAAAVAIIATLMAITRTNTVHALLYMILSLLAVSVVFFVIGAPYVAALQVIVYAGAIMVLFLFTLMFINMNKESEPHKSTLLKVAATLVAGCLTLVMVGGVTDKSASLPAPSADTEIGTVSNLGKSLYGDFVLPFEMTSILLLAAMVGAVMLARKTNNQED